MKMKSRGDAATRRRGDAATQGRRNWQTPGRIFWLNLSPPHPSITASPRRRVAASFLLLAFCLLPFAFCLPAKGGQKDEDKSAIAAAGFPKLADEYLSD